LLMRHKIFKNGSCLFFMSGADSRPILMEWFR